MLRQVESREERRRRRANWWPLLIAAVFLGSLVFVLSQAVQTNEPRRAGVNDPAAAHTTLAHYDDSLRSRYGTAPGSNASERGRNVETALQTGTAVSGIDAAAPSDRAAGAAPAPTTVP
jgi:hypothetical protein